MGWCNDQVAADRYWHVCRNGCDARRILRARLCGARGALRAATAGSCRLWTGAWLAALWATFRLVPIGAASRLLPLRAAAWSLFLWATSGRVVKRS